jgi:hypothetical protein
VGTTITFTTPVVEVVITGDTPYATCTYDALIDWYGVEAPINFEKRPSGPGSFAPKQTYPSELVVSVEGQFYGATRAAAIAMREDLALLYNDGEPITMTVADDLRTTSREVLIAAVEFPWTIHPEFNFTIDAAARDPRRYGEEIAQPVGLAVAGTGMAWPIAWPLDWGSIGTSGRILVSNPGNAATPLRFVVDGSGEMPDGFDVVNVTTGERIAYLGPVGAGNEVTVDGALRGAFINGTGPGSRWLSSPQWFDVPKRSTIEIAFLARGATSGTPTLTVYTSPAYY